MTERDAFEIRFGAAVHGYVGRVSSDLDPAELAHRIATAAPRRHGLAAGLALRGATIPRRSWVLLLLAALLSALVAGMLVVGSQPVRMLPAVVPPIGQLAECPPGSTPDEPGPVGQARPASLPAAAFDRRAGMLVSVRRSPGVDTETWTFDVCANTWTQMHPDRKPPTWGRLVYDADSDATLMVTEPGNVWAYDLQADSWTEKGDAPNGATLLFHDPVSGLVVAEAGDPRELWNYDVGTDTWTWIRLANGPMSGSPAFGASLAYDAFVDRIVAYTERGRPETWLLDIRARTWTKSAAETPVVGGWWVAPDLVYDEAAKRTVVFNRSPTAAYDASADRWEISDFGSPWLLTGSMVYDPVNERFIGFGASSAPVDMVAGDLLTGEWIVLLEPSGGQPATSSE
jgi:hypothetical protein